jgi:hypothetical protein
MNMKYSADHKKNIALPTGPAEPVLTELCCSLLDTAARQRLLDNKLLRAQHYTQVAQSLKLAKFHSQD